MPDDVPARPRVLVIDDEPALRALLVEFLNHIGADADQAGDGIEGLRVLARQTFDLVLSDHLMPRMTGLEVFEVIKEKYPSTKFALLTGSLRREAARRLSANGLTVLTKPISLRHFKAAMAELLPNLHPIPRDRDD